MKGLISILSLLAVLIFTPAVVSADSYETAANPPISQPLVREGTIAVKLVFALSLGATDNEVEAESLLGGVGIAPKNGWIADYPVTPDILGELQASVVEAAQAGRITMRKDEALKAFHDVMSEHNLVVAGDASGRTGDESASAYPDSTVINNYYYDYGPPVVTYYAPPPAYSYLYSWVPYPFWWWNFWFPGFFVLVDFHKTIIVDRHPVFLSNHFFDRRIGKIFRIDPVRRFHGRDVIVRGGTVDSSRARQLFNTIRDHRATGGERVFNSNRSVGAERKNVPSAVRERIFNAPARERSVISPRDGSRTVSPGRTFRQSSDVGRVPGRAAEGIFRGGSPASNSGRLFTSPSSGRGFSQPAERTFRSVSPSSKSDRLFTSPSGGGRSVSSFLGSGRGSSRGVSRR